MLTMSEEDIAAGRTIEQNVLHERKNSMAQRKIVWTETAAKQRRLTLEYWLHRNQSNTYPLQLLQLSDDEDQPIAENPFLYKADFPETHVAAMGHFSIFYKVKDTEIIITAFWDNRQDPKKLIELLGRVNVTLSGSKLDDDMNLDDTLYSFVSYDSQIPAPFPSLSNRSQFVWRVPQFCLSRTPRAHH